MDGERIRDDAIDTVLLNNIRKIPECKRGGIGSFRVDACPRQICRHAVVPVSGKVASDARDTVPDHQARGDRITDLEEGDALLPHIQVDRKCRQSEPAVPGQSTRRESHPDRIADKIFPALDEIEHLRTGDPEYYCEDCAGAPQVRIDSFALELPGEKDARGNESDPQHEPVAVDRERSQGN